MHKVTDEEVDFILDNLKANGVNTEDLQYNLLDHICCIIENEMPENENFYKFYENILPRFFKNELKEIQEETDNLLKFKHYYAMKKTLKISGIISSILMLAGATFKVMHWPGAGVMIVLGAISFSLIFLPLMIILKFRDEEKIIDKTIFAFSFILGIMGIVGSLFKIMHWPYANFLMISSSSIFIFAFIPLNFIIKYRRAEDQFNTIINSVLMLGFGCMIFALMNLSGSKNYNESIYSSYEFMTNNSSRTWEANAKIKNQNKELSNSELFKISDDLYNHVEETKAYLISIVNNTTIDKARKTKIHELKNPNAYQSIKMQFEEGNGEYSISALKSKVEDYNNVIKKLYPNNEEKIIAFDELQLDKTILSMVLFELSQLQLQIAQNDNSLLSHNLK